MAAQAGGLSSVASGQSPAFHAPGVDGALRSEVLPAGNPAKRQKTGVTGSSGPLGVPIKVVFETSGTQQDAEVDALRVRCLLVDTRSMQAGILDGYILALRSHISQKFDSWSRPQILASRHAAMIKHGPEV